MRTWSLETYGSSTIKRGTSFRLGASLRAARIHRGLRRAGTDAPYRLEAISYLLNGQRIRVNTALTSRQVTMGKWKLKLLFV